MFLFVHSLFLLADESNGNNAQSPKLKGEILDLVNVETGGKKSDGKKKNKMCVPFLTPTIYFYSDVLFFESESDIENVEVNVVTENGESVIYTVLDVYNKIVVPVSVDFLDEGNYTMYVTIGHRLYYTEFSK